MSDIFSKNKSTHGNYDNGTITLYDSNEPMINIIKRKDLFGHVSAYEIEPPSSYKSCKTDLDKLFSNFRANNLMISGNGYMAKGKNEIKLNIEDASVFGEDLKVSKLPTLGHINTHVGVHMFTNPELPDEDRYFIVVKNYDPHQTRSTIKHIENNPNTTIGDFVSDDLYKTTMENSYANNGYIALNLAKSMGFKFRKFEDDDNIQFKEFNEDDLFETKKFRGSSVKIPKPYIANKYNNFEKINKDSSQKYAAYSGVYGLPGLKSQGIIYGHGPTQGFTLFTHSFHPNNVSMGLEEFDFAYPMGIPKNKNIQNPHKDLNWDMNKFPTVDAKRATSIYSACPFDVHFKKNPGLYDQSFLDVKSEKKYEQNINSLKQMMGVDKTISSLRIKPVALYQSSFSENNLDMNDILKYHGQQYKIIRIPRNHTYITNSLMNSYMTACAKNPTLRLQDVIVGEDNTHFTLNKAYI